GLRPLGAAVHRRPHGQHLDGFHLSQPPLSLVLSSSPMIVPSEAPPRLRRPPATSSQSAGMVTARPSPVITPRMNSVMLPPEALDDARPDLLDEIPHEEAWKSHHRQRRPEQLAHLLSYLATMASSPMVLSISRRSSRRWASR